MTDNDMLEFAAKAAGLEVIAPCSYGRGLWVVGVEDEWNPLTEDADAFRLAVKLRMALSLDSPVAGPVGFCRAYPSSSNLLAMDEWANNDPYAATRRAIVRAAASIGEQLELNHGKA